MNRQFTVRLHFLCAVLALCVAAVLARLFSVQVLHGGQFAMQSKLQSQQRCIMPAQRGEIVDRFGRVLAASMRTDLSLSSDVLPVPKGKSKGAAAVKRFYPLGEAEGPLIGYIGRDGYGLGGVEFSYDKYLRGEDGWTILQKDGRNQRYRRIGLPYHEPRAGGTVCLTIDTEIQKCLYSVLKQTVDSLNAKGALGIVMDPFSGKLLAMANHPSFDPNYMSRYSIEERHNRCISAIFEPGSTFKLVTAAAALQEGIKKESDILDGNNGVFEIYHESIRDHVPYRALTFVQAFVVSSNVCFAKIATQIGGDRLCRYTQDFGFGSRAGITLPGEEPGIVHPVRTWSGRTLVTMAIGQEVSVTLLQMMLAYSAVANGGILVKPQICEKVIQTDGTVCERASVEPIRRVISEETARRLRAMLKSAVDSGTGKRAAVHGIPIAGKTGTAQKIDSGTYSKTRSWASFIGFLPSDRPCLLCGVMIDEPTNNLMGGTAAAPAFKKIITQIISHPNLAYAEQILHQRTIAPRSERRELKREAREIVAAADPEIVAAAVDRTAAGGKTAEANRGARLVPDCVGIDARDAVNRVHLRGLVPRVIGMGVVRRQHPPAGTMTRAAGTCTLECSLDG